MRFKELTLKSKVKIIGLVFIFLLVIFSLINLAYVQMTTSTRSGTGNNSISILTYNLHGYQHNNVLDKSINNIIELEPDVIVLQEAFSGKYQGEIQSPVKIIADLLNMTYFGVLSDQDYLPSGVGILSKFPIIDEYIIALPSLDVFTKYLVVTTINTPSGELIVTGTHMERPFYPNIQKQQAKKIVKSMSAIETGLFLCDCNSPDVIIHPAYRVFSSNFEDAWIADGHFAWQGNTWETPNPTLRVDYIWYKGKITIAKNSVERIGDAKASDHYGLYAELFI